MAAAGAAMAGASAESAARAGAAAEAAGSATSAEDLSDYHALLPKLVRFALPGLALLGSTLPPATKTDTVAGDKNNVPTFPCLPTLRPGLLLCPLVSAPPQVVFGGNGYVGSRVCQQGLAMGCGVVSVNRSGRPRNLRGDWLDQVEWVQVGCQLTHFMRCSAGDDLLLC